MLLVVLVYVVIDQDLVGLHLEPHDAVLVGLIPAATGCLLWIERKTKAISLIPLF